MYIYAATSGDGIWRRPVSEIITGINENHISTEDFTLSQNFPNPFNPMTKINFKLNQSLFTKLTVYDISGKKIKVLFDGHTNEGSYSVSFDGSDFPSGVYLYRLEIDGNVMDAKRMVLLK